MRLSPLTEEKKAETPTEINEKSEFEFSKAFYQLIYETLQTPFRGSIKLRIPISVELHNESENVNCMAIRDLYLKFAAEQMEIFTKTNKLHAALNYHIQAEKITRTSTDKLDMNFLVLLTPSAKLQRDPAYLSTGKG
jgi:hypothetical protein